MATSLVTGAWTWSMTRDEEGHRAYKVTHLVKTNAPGLDGPANALQTPGLPLPGSFWAFGNDLDLWAWCRANTEVRPYAVEGGEKHEYFAVDQIFSTKPLDKDTDRCQDQDIEDPLLEPAKISGSFVKYQEEAVYGYVFASAALPHRVLNSAHEQMRGPQLEVDRNRPQVRIEQNVLLLNLPLLSEYVDTVNDAALWGLPKWCIKLSNVSWERKFHGLCSIYYTRVLEFDINFDTFNRALLDEGTQALHGVNIGGKWIIKNFADGTVPDPDNPTHFVRYKDATGENARVVLDGFGRPIDDVPGTGGGEEAGTINFFPYIEKDFLLLGLPITF